MEKLYMLKKQKDGKYAKVALSSKEVKAYIMKANGWTAEEYRKKYDIFKNKLNAYESYQRSRGVSVEHQSVTALLFKQAKSKTLYGDEYQPSMKMQQIESFSAYSITKGRQLANTNERYQAKQTQKYADYVQQRFGGLIDHNKIAEKIDREIDDPVKKEKSLSALADKLKAKIDEQDKVTETEAIPVSSETYGSGDEIDFDIEQWK